jgi:hypothetical protein
VIIARKYDKHESVRTSGLFLFVLPHIGQLSHRSARAAEIILSPGKGERKMEENANDQNEDKGIAGTGFKTPEELAAAFVNEQSQRTHLEKKLGQQGSELGQLRTQAQTLAETLKETLGKGKQEPAAPGADFDKEIMSAQADLKKLDPMKDDFAEKQADLINRITDLKAEKVKTTVLKSAGELFQKELQDRDVKTSQKEFLKANPTFNTPEMQTRINDFLSQDATGMHDKMSAFAEIKAMDAQARANDLEQKNAEMMKALDLQQGKDSTGKVIVKGQSPGQITNKPILTGKERDAAMAEALAKVSGG